MNGSLGEILPFSGQKPQVSVHKPVCCCNTVQPFNRSTPDRFLATLCIAHLLVFTPHGSNDGWPVHSEFLSSRTPLNQSVQANNWDHHVSFKNPFLRRHFWWWKLKTVNLSSLRGLDPRSERSTLVGLKYFVQKIIVRRRGFWSATAKKKCFGDFDGYEHLP